MKKFVLLIIVFLPIALFGQFSSKWQPKKGKGEIVKHRYYMLSYNEQMEQANWVFYALYPKLIKGQAKRSNKFKSDPSVKTKSASLKDYKGSGYDRGHLCPAAAMRINTTSMNESFYMSNMSPQNPSFNRGVWKKLEAYARSCVRNDTLYIVSGPIFKDNIEKIGPNKVDVPGYYFKIIFDPYPLSMKAYLLPNKKSSFPLSHFRVSVDKIEKLTGIDFFYQLDDSIENRLESKK